MTKKEILAELQAWERVQKRLDAQIAKLLELADMNTSAVEYLVGDTTGALKWWKEQCKYGENPLSAAKGDKLRLISNLKQLAGLIAE